MGSLGGVVLDQLELLESFARSPNEEGIAVLESVSLLQLHDLNVAALFLRG